MADLDPKTATLREVAEAYAEKSGRGKDLLLLLQFSKTLRMNPVLLFACSKRMQKAIPFFQKH